MANILIQIAFLYVVCSGKYDVWYKIQRLKLMFSFWVSPVITTGTVRITTGLIFRKTEA